MVVVVLKKLFFGVFLPGNLRCLNFNREGNLRAKLLGILLEIYLFSRRILKCSFKLYHGHKKRKDGSRLVSYDNDGTCVLSGKITAFFFILSKSTERYWHCPGKLRFLFVQLLVFNLNILGSASVRNLPDHLNSLRE